jgi:hypothetical protein
LVSTKFGENDMYQIFKLTLQDRLGNRSTVKMRTPLLGSDALREQKLLAIKTAVESFTDAGVVKASYGTEWTYTPSIGPSSNNGMIASFNYLDQSTEAVSVDIPSPNFALIVQSAADLLSLTDQPTLDLVSEIESTVDVEDGGSISIQNSTIELKKDVRL